MKTTPPTPTEQHLKIEQLNTAEERSTITGINNLEQLCTLYPWLKDHLGTPTKLGWLRGHYHCRKCGGEIECWESFSGYHNSREGVSRVGGCHACGLIMVEHEYAPPRWVEVEL